MTKKSGWYGQSHRHSITSYKAFSTLQSKPKFNITFYSPLYQQLFQSDIQQHQLDPFIYYEPFIHDSIITNELNPKIDTFIFNETMINLPSIPTPESPSDAKMKYSEYYDNIFKLIRENIASVKTEWEYYMPVIYGMTGIYYDYSFNPLIAGQNNHLLYCPQCATIKLGKILSEREYKRITSNSPPVSPQAIYHFFKRLIKTVEDHKVNTKNYTKGEILSVLNKNQKPEILLQYFTVLMILYNYNLNNLNIDKGLSASEYSKLLFRALYKYIIEGNPEYEKYKEEYDTIFYYALNGKFKDFMDTYDITDDMIEKLSDNFATDETFILHAIFYYRGVPALYKVMKQDKTYSERDIINAIQMAVFTTPIIYHDNVIFFTDAIKKYITNITKKLKKHRGGVKTK